MKTYDLKVGYSCNNRCKHCVIEDSKDNLIEGKKKYDLTTKEIYELINIAYNDGVNVIVLTGGEVTIRKDFDKIIDKCKQKKFYISIQTNGRYLSKPLVKNTINNTEQIRLIVALHGAKSLTHDIVTQIKGSFLETITGLKEMVDLNKHIILKVVISKINQKELSDIVLLSSEIGLKYITFAFPHGQGAARKNFGEIIPTYTSLKDELEKTIKTSKQNNVNIQFEAIPFCIIPKHLKLVGEVRYKNTDIICTQVKEDTFNWNDARMSIKKKGKNCKLCYFDNLCEGVWQEYIEAFGEQEFIPISIDKNDIT